MINFIFQTDGVLGFWGKEDFKVVTSDLANEQSYALNGDPKHRGKVRSLIEPLKTYKPRSFPASLQQMLDLLL